MKYTFIGWIVSVVIGVAIAETFFLGQYLLDFMIGMVFGFIGAKIGMAFDEA